MNPIDEARQVAVVGSPSSNSEVTLDLLASSNGEGLVGNLLFLANPQNDGGTELALGSVTEVVTHNQWHQNPAFRGVIAKRGGVPSISGDAGDIRAAIIRIQAAYRQDAPGEPWRQSGPSLRMSPATGTPIRRATDEVLSALTAQEPDRHFLGLVHGGGGVRLPLNMPDFSGAAGSYHCCFFGATGAGKTSFGSYWLAGQMRHLDMGMIIVDPQGQFSSEHGIPFSLQGWAAELGREVVRARISSDLRLSKDAPLLAELLGKTKFTREIIKMSSETQEFLLDELAKILRKRENWEDEPSDVLLTHLLNELLTASVLGRIYADQAKRDRLQGAIAEVLADHDRMQDVLGQFSPLHNLFMATNPGGGPRRSMWGAIRHVFDKAARAGGPAPLLILDMSTDDPTWAASLPEQEARVLIEALRVLDQDSIKAAVLSQTFRSLKQAAESAFRDGETLNTLVVIDEASRFAPPPSGTEVKEIQDLTAELADGARTLRKFGVGLCFITQTVKSLNPAIWDQLTIRMVGYGLGGADLDKVSEHLDSRDSLALYRQFAPPASTNPKTYPWMLAGPVSPLSFTRAPVFLSAYTSFDDFRTDNAAWIEALALRAGRRTGITGLPTPPVGTGRKVRATVTVDGVKAAPVGFKAADAIRKSADRTRMIVAAGPPASTLRPTDPSFGGGLDALDVDEPPF